MITAFSGAKGEESSSNFTQKPDNLRSEDTFEGLLGLSIGPIKGPTNGLKSIRLDGTPIQNSNGESNFPGFIALIGNGDPLRHPDIIRLRLGAAASPLPVNVGLVNPPGGSSVWVARTLNNVSPDYIDLRFIVSQLYKQTEEGVFNNTASIEIEMKPTGTSTWINPLLGATSGTAPGGTAPKDNFLNALLYTSDDHPQPTPVGDGTYYNTDFKITGKTTGPVVFELRIWTPTAGAYANKTWDIRARLVEKDTVDADPNFEKRSVAWESAAAVYSDEIGEEEDWRGVAWMQFYGKASDQLTGVPEVEVETDAKIVAVPPPSRYNAATRTYSSGIWDGSWASAWTNDPAWVINDAISDELSGLSLIAPNSYLNKWDALEASKWFSEKVPDGKGGTHPRYSLNVVANQQMKAEEFIRYLAGAVGGFAWDEGDGQWRMKVDKNDNPVDLFTLENIDGEFVYSHTDVDTRFNDYTGTFLNEEFDYREDTVHVYDNESIALIGHKPTSIALVGCTNRQEGLRRLMVRMRSSVNETRLVSFTTNRRGRNIEQLDTILVADGHLGDQHARTTGRTVAPRINKILSSQNASVTPWGHTHNAAAVVSTKKGLDGSNAYDINDATTSGSASRRQVLDILANTETYNASVYIAKTVNATVSAALYVSFAGGTVATSAIVVNTNTGQHVHFGDTPAFSSYVVEDAGDYWRLSGVAANDGTNTSIDYRVYPAWSLINAVGGRPNLNNSLPQTGSKTMWGPQVTVGSELQPYQANVAETVASIANSVTLRDTMRLEIGVTYKLRFAELNSTYNSAPATQPTGVDWKKPTIVAERTVTNTTNQRGDVNTIFLSAPLPAGLPDNLAVALEAVDLPTIPRLYRVTNVVYDDDGEKVSISAMEIDTGKQAAADAVSAINTVFVDLRGSVPKPLPPPDGDMLKIVTTPARIGVNVSLVANWQRPPGGTVSGFRVTYKVNGGAEQVLTQNTTIPTADLVNPSPGTYEFFVYTIGRSGKRSAPLTDIQVVGSETRDAIVDALTLITADNILTAVEKRDALVPNNARFEVQYKSLLNQASSSGYSTVDMTAARTAWLALLNSYLPTWNNLRSDTDIYTPVWGDDADTFPEEWTTTDVTADPGVGIYTTLTDASTTAAGSIERSHIEQTAAVRTYSAGVAVKKDAVDAGTRSVALHMASNGGTAKNGRIILDSSTGEALSAGLVASGALDMGEAWFLWATFQTNADNTGVEVKIFPSYGNSFTLNQNVAATGAIQIQRPAVALGDWKALGKGMLLGRMVDFWSTMENLNALMRGYPIAIQWSSDGLNNPNQASLWHSNYVAGQDFFMRQSTDNGVTWGVAIRAVGENGASGPYTQFVFQRAATQPPPPTGDGPIPAGWADAPPADNGTHLWMSSAQLSSTGVLQGVWSYPIKLEGTNGLNTSVVMLYRRAATAPAVPSVPSTFTFSTGLLSGHNNSWTQSVPTANGQPLWVTTAPASNAGSTDIIASNEWATPTIMSQDGTSGLNSAVIFIYRRSPTAPPLPSASSTYTFSSGTLVGLTNSWTTTIPTSNGESLWVSTVTALSVNDTDSIPATEWAAPTILVSDGQPGLSNAVVMLYRRSATAPAVPSVTSTYTFATGVLSGHNNSWTQTIPASNGSPLYVTSAFASGSSSTDTIASSEWAAPTIMAQDGTPGGGGNQGVYLMGPPISYHAMALNSGNVTVTGTLAADHGSGTGTASTLTIVNSVGTVVHTLGSANANNATPSAWATINSTYSVPSSGTYKLKLQVSSFGAGASGSGDFNGEWHQ